MGSTGLQPWLLLGKGGGSQLQDPGRPPGNGHCAPWTWWERHVESSKGQKQLLQRKWGEGCALGRRAEGWSRRAERGQRVSGGHHCTGPGERGSRSGAAQAAGLQERVSSPWAREAESQALLTPRLPRAAKGA